MPQEVQEQVREQDMVETQRPAGSEEDGNRSDSSDARPAMSQFISPRSAANSPATKSRGLPQLGDERSAVLPTDLSKSSILAIHRPIAARRRTESGEPGEVLGEDGMYMSQTSEGRIAEEGQVPDENEETLEEAKKRPLPPSRTATAKTEKSMGRRLKLAEKLMDVFGLEEVEDVVAGESTCFSCSPELSTHSPLLHRRQSFLVGSSAQSSFKVTST